MDEQVVNNLVNQIKSLIDDKADKTVATASSNGLMSMTDKAKLDNLEIQIIDDTEDIEDDGIYIIRE